MRVWSIIFSLIILCMLAACKENGPDLSTKDTVRKVVMMPENSHRHDGLPSALTESLLALEFNVDPAELKIIGGIPEAKIKLYDVAAYVEYAGGWLIASGYGEWGGVLFWIDRNGGYEVIRDDDSTKPIDVMTDGNTILIILAPTHHNSREAYLLEVSRNNGTFKKSVYPLNIFPEKFEIYNGEWIIPSFHAQEYFDDQKYFFVSELRAGKTLLHDRN